MSFVVCVTMTVVVTSVTLSQIEKKGEKNKHPLSDPGLQHMANDFTPEMFTVEGIEVLGTPIGTDSYIKNFVAQNCVKIMRDTRFIREIRSCLSRGILDQSCHHRNIHCPSR
jgi:hypothetical protein